MKQQTLALQQYLNQNAKAFAQKWHEAQTSKAGSHYSPDAPQQVQLKIKQQTENYLILIAAGLTQSEEALKQTISEWTSKTAADRIESTTTLTEVIKSNQIFRKVMMDYVLTYTKENRDFIELEELFAWNEILNKALDYSLESFSFHYMNLLTDRLASQASLIKELSAPVIALTDQVGLLPIIGDIDTERAKTLIDTTLQQSVDAQINILIIDLSGVVLVDTMVAQQIFQLIDALKMIGVDTVLTGIRPEVAQTTIQLGLNFSGIETYSSLKSIFQKLTKEQNFI
ncbi:STAS domain-containing protein [Bacillus sp. 1P06AnD]|uniref:STAS domain-containing protein n=1 Tax=Bacillus sp. 1P06AnD TaxID=3132208 RepID=UPI00399FEA94